MENQKALCKMKIKNYQENVNSLRWMRLFTFILPIGIFYFCYGTLSAFIDVASFTNYPITLLYLILLGFHVVSVVLAIRIVLYAKRADSFSYKQYINYFDYIIVPPLVEVILCFVFAKLFPDSFDSSFLWGTIAQLARNAIFSHLNIKYFEKRKDFFEIEDYENKINEEDVICENSSSIAYENLANKDLFCHKCGERLIEDSNFCRKCGTPIISNDTVINHNTVAEDEIEIIRPTVIIRNDEEKNIYE